MVWSSSRVARRAIPFVACVLTLFIALGATPAAAAGSGVGTVDGDYTTATDLSSSTTTRTYPALYFFGALTVGNATYDGGFYVAGMTDKETGVPLPCVGVCLPTPGQLTWTGVDAGDVNGFDPTPAAVSGQCSIVKEADTVSGPLNLLEVTRTLDISCSISLGGAAAQSVELGVTAVTDQAANGSLAGVFVAS